MGNAGAKPATGAVIPPNRLTSKTLDRVWLDATPEPKPAAGTPDEELYLEKEDAIKLITTMQELMGSDTGSDSGAFFEQISEEREDGAGKRRVLRKKAFIKHILKLCPAASLSASLEGQVELPPPPSSPPPPPPSSSSASSLALPQWETLSFKAPGGATQKAEEAKRHMMHLKEFKASYRAIPSMCQASPAPVPSSAPSAAPGAMPWIPGSKSDYCNKLVKGPKALAYCPKAPKYGWNCWKCIRCGEVYVFPAGGCKNGCSWYEWGWVCIYHHGVNETVPVEEYKKRLAAQEAIADQICR